MEKIEIEELLNFYGLSGEHDSIKIERMGGLTNRNFVATTSSGQYALRLPGKDTEKIINRSHEGEIVDAIAHLNIDAPLIGFDKKTGIKVCNYLTNALTMNQTLMREPKRMKQAAGLLKILHDAAIVVDVPFDVFEMADKYERQVEKENGYLPKDFIKIRHTIMTLRKQYDTDYTLVLCHNDPLSENFIVDDHDEMFLVDWEYGGMNSPYWDLADVLIEVGYNDDEAYSFISEYLGHEPSEEVLRMVNLNKLYIDFLWSLWGYVMQTLSDENDTYDYIAYGDDRYRRLKLNLEQFDQATLKM